MEAQIELDELLDNVLRQLPTIDLDGLQEIIEHLGRINLEAANIEIPPNAPRRTLLRLLNNYLLGPEFEIVLQAEVGRETLTNLWQIVRPPPPPPMLRGSQAATPALWNFPEC